MKEGKGEREKIMSSTLKKTKKRIANVLVQKKDVKYRMKLITSNLTHADGCK